MRQKAFTLVELLVVIGIIAVLIGILLPVLGAARRQANTVKCAAGLREIGNCFKMYELDSKGYWPIGRINGMYPGMPSSAVGTLGPYNVDGVDYNTAIIQAHWWVQLAKYVTKSKTGVSIVGSSDAKTNTQVAQNSIFYGCPSWQGYTNGTNTVVDNYNVVQPGYGMDIYPTFTADYPPPQSTATNLPANAETSQYGPNDAGGPTFGKWFKASAWTKPAEHMLVADSRFWCVMTYRPPVLTTYPPAIYQQPILANTAAGLPGIGQTYVDIYRHGKYPSLQNSVTGTPVYDPRGGKVAYNILYCDGHVATPSDGREAYRSFRMKFPG